MDRKTIPILARDVSNFLKANELTSVPGELKNITAVIAHVVGPDVELQKKVRARLVVDETRATQREFRTGRPNRKSA